uniref:DYW domain-containing protein n=1 Tax=Kalanchoe fedtschenkoi TaxID=63787 RepID=A0A7N0VAT0_KALFE
MQWFLGYAQNGLASEVLDLYKRMEFEGICPDAVTYVGVLSSCANLGAQTVGSQVEHRIESSGLSCNPFLKNALINMHVRCGNLLKARGIFDRMSEKTLVSWTAMIGGYGVHGQGEVAVRLFDEMIRSGVTPDQTAFVCVLSACSHAGLSDKGLEYFEAMKNQYKLHPGPEHYSCVVDLLGRVGRLKEARELIDSMPVEADGAVWGALLGACKIHKNVGLAEIAFQRVIELEPENVGYYVLLSNIYSDAGNIDGLVKVRLMMREQKLKKEPGHSYVEHKGKIHLFIAGDREHPQTEEIYRMLDKLEDLMTGVVMAQKNNGDSEKEAVAETGVGVHSEKLAAVFGLLNTDAGTDVVIIKNLRICRDCHLFMKLVSKIVERQLVVRDATRFHHFKNGVCSCKEHW